jgi:hypothetical protein
VALRKGALFASKEFDCEDEKNNYTAADTGCRCNLVAAVDSAIFRRRARKERRTIAKRAGNVRW